MTHGLPFIGEYWDGSPGAPRGRSSSTAGRPRRSTRGDLDTLFAFREKAPGMPFAHPTVEHFAPLFVTLGASAKPDDAPKTAIDGFFLGLSKRSIETASASPRVAGVLPLTPAEPGRERGEPAGIRTQDQGIKSPLLYR